MITTNVNVRVSSPTGEALANALVTAVLDRAEIDPDGYVIPITVVGRTDATGLCVLALWPNSRGVNSSAYDIVVKTQDNRTLTIGDAVVPESNTPVDLEDIASKPRYENDTDGIKAAVAQMQVVKTQAIEDINARRIEIHTDIENRKTAAIREIQDSFSSHSRNPFQTYAELDSNKNFPEFTTAVVFDDPDPARNGWYYKLGAPNTGTWKFMPIQPATTTVLADMLKDVTAKHKAMSDLLLSPEGDNLYTFADSAGKVVARVNRSGEWLFLNDPITLQAYITALKQLLAQAGITPGA